MMLALGALFVSLSTEYAPEIYSLLFGEVLGVSSNQVAADPVLGARSASPRSPCSTDRCCSPRLLPEVAEARGIGTFAIELAFLGVVALATTMTVPVVGTLLIFSLMIGPPAAARSLTDRPGVAMALSVVIALAIVWSAIGASYATDWPVGFFVGTASAAAYVLARLWQAGRERYARRRVLGSVA